MIVAVTGHRLPRLGLSYSLEDENKLVKFCVNHLKTQPLPVKFITGMANGFDLAIAIACSELKIPFIAALAFEGQVSNWPTDSQRRWENLLTKAEKVVTVSKGKPENYKYIIRDKWMVDNSDRLVALWDGEKKGGTWQTVSYSMSKQKVDILNLWGHYKAFQENGYEFLD